MPKKTKQENLEGLMEFLKRCSGRMRKNPTKWEKILYTILKELKYKFKSQYPIICREKYGYIVDFLLTDYNIFIEVDGKKYHSSKEQIKKDNMRTRRLRKEGYEPIRLTNRQVSTYTKQQIDSIIQTKIQLLSVKNC